MGEKCSSLDRDDAHLIPRQPTSSRRSCIPDADRCESRADARRWLDWEGTAWMYVKLKLHVNEDMVSMVDRYESRFC